MGLGVAGVCAARSAAESGLKVIAVEKTSGVCGRSSQFSFFNCDKARESGIEDIDTNALVNELMTQMSHRADPSILKKWADNCGEAITWYAEGYDGIQWVPIGGEKPADENQVYTIPMGAFPEYDPTVDHERIFSGTLNFRPKGHTPVLQANFDKAVAENGLEAYFDSPARQLIRGEDAVEFPEDGYHGDDIRELARLFYQQEGEKYLDCDEKTRHDALAKFGLDHNIPKMKTDLARYGIQYDAWFFESTLHESGYVADSVKALTQRGYTYEKDGALWLATSRILAENLKKAGKSDEDIEKLGLKDDVLRRANGFYTYFAADIAYHRNKFAVRGFDKVINVWGADHHGHVARLKGAMDALGLDGEHRLDIVLMQLVKLVRDGEVVRMSKRTGKAISLTDLLDEIPVDACRYFFNAKPETQMEFDLGLAVREDSENPVYYVQYAHARICTLLKNLEAEGYTVPAADAVDFSLLTDETEQALIKQIASYGQVVLLAARDYDPSHINRYLTALAAAFHKFYAACRIKGEEEPVLLARLKLADTTRAVLKNAMTLIGCSAPEKM